MREVVAAWLHATEVDVSFLHSVLHCFGRELLGQQRLMQWLPTRCGSNELSRGRNDTTSAFLAGDGEWLWWIDTDMGFAPDALDQLLAVADPDTVPIVGGLCFASIEREPDGMGGFITETVPTLYRWVETDDGKHSGFVPWRGYPRDELLEVAGTGSAFILIHRHVFEGIAEQLGAEGAWYDRMVNPSTGQLLGEDLSFCARAKMAGFPIHVHTGIRTTHRKAVWLTERHYDQQLQEVARGDRERADLAR